MNIRELKSLIALVPIVIMTSCQEEGTDAVRQFNLDRGTFLTASGPTLTTPFRFQRVTGPNRIQSKEPDGRPITIIAKGIALTGDSQNDQETEFYLHLWADADNVCLIKDSVTRIDSNMLSGIVCSPRVRTYIGKDELTGEMKFSIESYAVVQVGLLVTGRAELDRRETNYPQFAVFDQAEALAKKYKQGRWGR